MSGGPQAAASAPGSDPQARRRLVANERVKITATMLNNAAVAAFIASVAGPAVAAGYGATVPRSPYRWAFGGCWIYGAIILLLSARWVLGELQP